MNIVILLGATYYHIIDTAKSKTVSLTHSELHKLSKNIESILKKGLSQLRKGKKKTKKSKKELPENSDEEESIISSSSELSSEEE